MPALWTFVETVRKLVPWTAGFGQIDSQIEQPVHLLAVKGLFSLWCGDGDE